MSQVCSSNCYSYNLKLLKNLINDNYSTSILPGSDTNSYTLVYVYFTLVKLLSLQTTGSISIAGAFTFAWLDPRLTWNQLAYNNITVIQIPTNSVWTPYISLMNGVSQSLELDLSDSVASVNMQGRVSLVSAHKFDATCAMDLKLFPYDTQTCTYSFQSIDLRGMDYKTVTFATETNSVNTEIYTPSGEFTLANTTITTGYRVLNNFNLAFPTFSVTLTFVRNPSYYIGTVAVPALLLLFASGLVFVLPSDNSVKIAMACSLMVAMYVLQQAVSRMLPASQTTSLLSAGIMIELGLGCYSLMCSILQVALRSAKPPLSKGCVKFLQACQPYLSSAERPAHAANKVEPLPLQVHPDSDSQTQVLIQTQPEKQDALTAAIYSLIKSNNWQLECAQKAEMIEDHKAEQARLWKVMDLILSAVFLFIYITVAAVTSVVYLFGLSSN